MKFAGVVGGWHHQLPTAVDHFTYIRTPRHRQTVFINSRRQLHGVVSPFCVIGTDPHPPGMIDVITAALRLHFFFISANASFGATTLVLNTAEIS